MHSRHFQCLSQVREGGCLVNRRVPDLVKVLNNVGHTLSVVYIPVQYTHASIGMLGHYVPRRCGSIVVQAKSIL